MAVSQEAHQLGHFFPSNLGGPTCKCKMATLVPVCTEHVQGHGAPPCTEQTLGPQEAELLLRPQLLPCGWLSGAEDPLVREAALLLTWCLSL